MKTLPSSLIFVSCLACCGFAAPAGKPNIIVIFTDDQGYGDLSSYGAEGFVTAEIDRMAAEGMRFTEFYAAHSVCTPSRAGLLTGRYAARWGNRGSVFWPYSSDGMPPSEVTLAEMLKAQGYATAAIGKWHLGHLPEYLPTAQGFDAYLGLPYSNDMCHDGGMPLADNVKFLGGMTLEDYKAYQPQGKHWKVAQKEGRAFKHMPPLVLNNEVIEWPADQSQLTRRYTERAIQWIDTNKEQPFFIYLAHSMPHTPLAASEPFKGKTERGLYGDVMTEIDWSVGQILQALRERGLEEKTLVIFTSDNGPWLQRGDDGGSAGPLRAGKRSSYEGGHRVPGVFWWQGHIPSGVVSDYNATALDLFPTLAKVTGSELPTDRKLDGMDISQVLLGAEDQQALRKNFIYMNGQAIRVGDWKYRFADKYGSGVEVPNGEVNVKVEQLFNLKKDIGEQNNVIDQYPEKAQELKKQLEQHWKDVEKDR
ncbi:sulfatase family protein [Pontiella sulfatireligans]|uniref:Arylsulfatase n=1 Tax=Pontiella sulfatireligans TaxID=2750658 RepID=A0A6C2UGB9_9BACT|nr:sulfatase [Pontiella sulfatireligans]SPS74275.1 sulfatase S1_14 [Kiritimatiellales bacterium]VGO18959.1 Arylsulfatase [Pontiella sulfatireligans]